MALFDRSAKGYDAWFETPIGKFVEKIETKALFSLVDDIRGARVLDFGCGTGHLSVKLAQNGAELTEIDISKSMLQKAQMRRDKLGLDILYQQKNVHDMNFEPKDYKADEIGSFVIDVRFSNTCGFKSE